VPTYYAAVRLTFYSLTNEILKSIKLAFRGYFCAGNVHTSHFSTHFSFRVRHEQTDGRTDMQDP